MVHHESTLKFVRETFEFLSRDVWTVREQFKPQVIVRIQLLGQFKLENQMDNLTTADGQSKILAHSIGLFKELPSGRLYVQDFEQIQHFVFLHNDFEYFGREIYKLLLGDRRLSGHLWFSHLPKGAQIKMHTDQAGPRWHYVVQNNPETPSIILADDKKIFARPGETFEIDPRLPHGVPIQTSDRVHLIATL